jgi:hypothetical protein
MNSQRPLGIDSRVNIASLSGLLTILGALGIIFIGVREFFYPSVVARRFGVPLLDPADGDLLAIKAGRDTVSGILALTFLGLRDRRFLACDGRPDSHPAARWFDRPKTCDLDFHSDHSGSLGDCRLHASDRGAA